MNAVVIQMPCGENLVDIVSKDMSWVKRENIESIRLYHSSLDAYVKIDSQSYREGISLQQFLKINKINP